MTTTPRKTSVLKKARAVSSGFLERIDIFVLTPRQGIAGRRTSFESVAKRATRTIIAHLSATNQKAYGPLIDGGLKDER